MKHKASLFVALAVVTLTPTVLAQGLGAVVAGGWAGPAGGFGASYAAYGVAAGPFGGLQGGSAYASSFTGPGGVTVDHVAGSSMAMGPLGGLYGRSASATRVTGPGGASLTYAQSGPGGLEALGGVSVQGFSTVTGRTPQGIETAMSDMGGMAMGPFGGVVGDPMSAVSGWAPMGGGIPVDTRVGAVAGPYGGTIVGQTTTYLSPNSVRAAAHAARSESSRVYHTSSGYQVSKAAWVPPNVVAGASAYRPPAWEDTASFVGVDAPPVRREPGSTVIINDNRVYVHGERVASADEYTEQAARLADTGRQARPAQSDEWKPLGVFGLLQGGEKVAQRTFQLAVNHDGVVRGNYTDIVSDNSLPVVGSVDKKSQRVAWSIGDRKDLVFETGLSNFTKNETTVLVHRKKGSTQQMILVRLEEPADGKREGGQDP
jgi:hypothetical protein